MFKPTIKSEQTDLLVRALVSISSKDEAYRFLEDICTTKEILEISQRIAVAQMLNKQHTYNDVANTTKASSATISRVNKALHYGSGGYASVFKSINKKSDK